jgi:hypothetical protein
VEKQLQDTCITGPRVHSRYKTITPIDLQYPFGSDERVVDYEEAHSEGLSIVPRRERNGYVKNVFPVHACTSAAGQLLRHLLDELLPLKSLAGVTQPGPSRLP